jgi:hypothetical protein
MAALHRFATVPGKAMSTLGGRNCSKGGLISFSGIFDGVFMADDAELVPAILTFAP